MMKEFVIGTILLVLCSRVSGLGSVVSTTYTYKHYPLSWQDARDKCIGLGGDLVIFYAKEDTFAHPMAHHHAWVGKYNFDSGSGWSDQGSIPRKLDNCGYFCSKMKSIRNTKDDKDCNHPNFFICSINGQDIFFLQTMSWSDALSYCRSRNGDLLSETGSDQWIDSGFRPDFPVWTGLHRQEGKWKWTSGVSKYRNWSMAQPDNSGDCATISSLSKGMSTHSCNDAFPYLCFQSNLVLVKENKTWEEALEHCRGLESKHDLISVQPGGEQTFLVHMISMEADTEEVWTGLRFLAAQWLWINEATLTHSNLPGCPPVDRHCGALVRNDPEKLGIRDCSDRRNFLCYKDTN